MPISLRALNRTYARYKASWPSSVPTRFVAVTDPSTVQRMLASTMSCCWGAGQTIDDTGWVQLCSPSPSHKHDPRIIFVCRQHLLPNKD